MVRGSCDPGESALVRGAATRGATSSIGYAAALIALLATPAIAQQQQQQSSPCGPQKDVYEFLGQQHHEKPIAAGVDKGDRLMELWSSQNDATWTIVVVRPDGVACIAGSGKSLEFKIGPQGEPV